MKSVVALTCLAATLVVAYGRFCSGPNDCAEGECCVARSMVELTRKGRCARLSREGKVCSELDAKLEYFGGKYALFCPCQAGLSCGSRKLKPENSDRGKFLASLRCQKVPTTAEQELTTELDIVEETTPEENIGDEVTFDEGTADEGTKIGAGPGGERPRDDDCQNWEYPC